MVGLVGNVIQMVVRIYMYWGRNRLVQDSNVADREEVLLAFNVTTTSFKGLVRNSLMMDH